MSYLISAFAFGLLFSVLCGACMATVALALKWGGATALGIVFGVLVFALYVLYALRKQKKLRESAPVFDEKEALRVELSAHFYAQAYRGAYTLYVFSDRLCFFSPHAPTSLQNLTFKKEHLAIDKVLVSPEEEDLLIYDLVLYEGKEQVAQLHTRARFRADLEQTLESLGYFEAPIPQMLETE
ncbi:MAG: hypothetical protein J6V82_00150 [Clostridia bacterium]|nr:hypothetical protein [Clostridia bacterium]